MRCGATINADEVKRATLKSEAATSINPTLSCKASGVLPNPLALRLSGYKGGRIRRNPKPNVPLEEDEQIAFVDWCKCNQILVHHSPMEIGGSSQAVKVRAIKMKRMGASKGFPDLLVFIPVKNVFGEVESYQMCAIEMKRTKGSTTSEEQKQWIQILESAGIPCAICKGATKAIEFINNIRKEIDPDDSWKTQVF